MTEEIQESGKQEVEKSKRKWFFTLLLVLTLINCLIGFLVSFGLLFKIAFIDIFTMTPVIDTAIAEGKSGTAGFHLVKILVLLGVVWGTIKMWKLKKSGFFIYLAMQIAILVLPYVFLIHLGFWYIFVNSAVNLVFLVLFIMLYTLQLEKMNKKTAYK